MKRLALCSSALLACMSAACVKATLSDDLSDSQQLTYTIPNSVDGVTLADACSAVSVSGSYQVPPLTESISEDFSGDISQISKVSSNLSVAITQLTMTNPNNEFGFVSSVEVDIVGADTSTYPQVMLATAAMGTAPGSMITVKPSLPVSEVLSYLSAGEVTLTVTLTFPPLTMTEACALGNLPAFTTMLDMSVHVSDTFQK
jgi:hypothetical protein